MTRCRVGDLAVIIADDHESQSNIGKFVHVMGKANPESTNSTRAKNGNAYLSPG